MNSFFCSIIFLLPVLCYGTELQPWFGKDKLIESRTAYTYRHYSRVNQGHHSSHHSSNDHFLNVGLSISPTPLWSAEIEVITADTSHRSFGFDNIRLTGRYLLLDDVVGDPFSCCVGFTADFASQTAVRDISSFHHGQAEYAFHLSLGKEVSCEEFWTSRLWGVILCGIANQGSPWLETTLAYEKNTWDIHQWRLFMHGLVGFGQHNLHLKSFDGYGSIAHRSLDVGGRYSYLLTCGTISLEYAYRVWAHNFPAQAHTLFLSLMIPFGF